MGIRGRDENVFVAGWEVRKIDEPLMRGASTLHVTSRIQGRCTGTIDEDAASQSRSQCFDEDLWTDETGIWHLWARVALSAQLVEWQEADSVLVEGLEQADRGYADRRGEIRFAGCRGRR